MNSTPSDKRKKGRKKERKKERKNNISKGFKGLGGPLCCGQNTIQRESPKKQTSRLQPQLDFLMRILPNLQFVCHQHQLKQNIELVSQAQQIQNQWYIH